MKSLSKAQIKWIRSLHTKKGRAASACFMVEGHKAVAEALASGVPLKLIAGSEEILATMGPEQPFFHTATSDQLATVSALSTPPGIVAVAEIPQTDFSPEMIRGRTAFICDGIRDPGNLGTLVRTADWFGHPCMICSPDCADLFNPKTVQSTMGSVFRVPVFYMDLQPLMKLFRESHSPIWATTLDGDNLFDRQDIAPGLILLGSESHGLKPELAKEATGSLRIPGGTRGTESLNVAMAGSILAAEFHRLTRNRK
ncbi:MAG: RNA methyltransferase [Flavobacteriales bacterium]|nr:RNA methyltransferase [Flavobacteriales bacterium]MCB9447404.1 RNA methyltransferase [Flavobacteriales bacterium]